MEFFLTVLISFAVGAIIGALAIIGMALKMEKYPNTNGPFIERSDERN